jgi:hypothetical protein
MYEKPEVTTRHMPRWWPRKMRVAVMAIVVFGIFVYGCSRDAVLQPQSTSQLARPVTNSIDDRSLTGHGEFRIIAKYDSIDSYPSGGGVFLIRLNPGDDFSGPVRLTIKADPRLHADLSAAVLNPQSPVAEITIMPEQTFPIGLHTITVLADNASFSRKLILIVNIINWWIADKRNAVQNLLPFAEWLEKNHPELGDFLEREWYIYATYPGILVVEHWTFLDAEWEIRVCHHVMIPPYDWSKMLLRKRGEWEPTLAAKRETDGIIHQIPIADYPIMGY